MSRTIGGDVDGKNRQSNDYTPWSKTSEASEAEEVPPRPYYRTILKILVKQCQTELHVRFWSDSSTQHTWC